MFECTFDYFQGDLSILHANYLNVIGSFSVMCYGLSFWVLPFQSNLYIEALFYLLSIQLGRTCFAFTRYFLTKWEIARWSHKSDPNYSSQKFHYSIRENATQKHKQVKFYTTEWVKTKIMSHCILTTTRNENERKRIDWFYIL